MSLIPIPRVWRLSALRQAVALTVAFIVLLAVTGALAVSEFSRRFEDRVEDELRARYTAVQAEIRAEGYDRARFPNTGMERVIVLPEGGTIRPGFHDDFDDHWRSGHSYGGQWLYLAGPAASGQLVIGTNLGRRDDFIEIIAQSLWFIGMAAAVAALVLGVFFGLRTQKRLTRIGTTLDAAGAGDLAVRTAVSTRRDDLDDLAAQVDRTLDQLDVMMRQTRDFSANIAHDLKTPLARLRLRLEKALDVELTEGDSAEQIGLALEQTDRVIGIFDAFLRIAKLESGAARAKFDAVDLGQLVRDTADIYEAVVEETGRSLRVETDHPSVVQGDRVLLTQMLANLIENAMRHTPEGTEMRLIARGSVLGLADNGPGIPADEYDRVLQPLYRLEKSRTTEGAGLGLALVRTIAALHKAELILSPTAETTPKGLFIRADFPENPNLTAL